MQQDLTHKKCWSCKELKPLDQYHKNKHNKNGHATRCKACACLATAMWRENNVNRFKKANESWRKNNPDKAKEIARKNRAKYRIEYPERFMVSGAKQRAKQRNLEFCLAPEDISIPDTCPLLGIKLERSSGKMSPSSPSLDRIDPRRGYTKDNVWVISQRANVIKNDATPSELIQIAEVLIEIFPHLTNAHNQIQNKPSKETV
jgi:hypothetical protein